jgi:CheY-like chemotaxis protein
MPKVNGFEFLQTLRADSRTRHIPVLVLTAKHLTIEEQNDLSQAAQIVIAKKTFTPEQLLEKLQYLERVRPLLTPAADFTPRANTPAASVDMAQFHDDFMAEAHTCLSNLDVALEQYAHSHDANAIESAARAAHTLKGAASLMSYAELSDAAARAEDLLNDQPALDLQRLALIRGLQRSMERMIARIQAPASV